MKLFCLVLLAFYYQSALFAGGGYYNQPSGKNDVKPKSGCYKYSSEVSPFVQEAISCEIVSTDSAKAIAKCFMGNNTWIKNLQISKKVLLDILSAKKGIDSLDKAATEKMITKVIKENVKTAYAPRACPENIILDRETIENKIKIEK